MASEKGINTHDANGGSFYGLGAAFAIIPTCAILIPTALASFGFLCGISLNPAIFLVGIAIGLITAFFLIRDTRNFLLALAVTILIAFIFYSLLVTTIDLSFDSLSYHTRAIDDLAQGYNPVRETHEVPWIKYYPKGSWTFQAGIFQLTKSMESTSTINLLGIVIAFGCSLMFAARVKTLPKYAATTLVICSTFAPIAVVQAPTHLVDGFFGSLAIASLWIVAGYMLGVFDRRDLRIQVLLGMIFLLLSLNKFTGFVFSCVLLAVYLGYLLTFYRTADEVKRFLLFSGVLLVSLLIISYSPYVQNSIAHKNPFYPILSSDIHSFKDAPDDRQRPSAYKNVNPISGLLMSLTEPAKNINDSHGYRLKFPLSISKSEIQALGGPDTAIGGNGPFFFLSILLGLISYAYFLFLNDVSRRRKLITAFLLASVIMSSLAMLETWWARLVPFLAMLPILLLLIISSKKDNRVLQVASILLSVVMICNTAIILYATVDNVRGSQSSKRTIEEYFANNKPTYFRFDPDTHTNVQESLRRIMKDFGSTATELPQTQPSTQILFIDDVTGDEQIRFIYPDDPPADQSDIKNTWEHVVSVQSLFTFIDK